MNYSFTQKALAIITLSLMSVLFCACPVKVSPGEVQDSDRFCSYTITSIDGEGVHAVDEIVCVLCKSNVRWCKTDMEIKAGGVTYTLARVADFLECRPCHGSAVAIYRRD